MVQGCCVGAFAPNLLDENLRFFTRWHKKQAHTYTSTDEMQLETQKHGPRVYLQHLTWGKRKNKFETTESSTMCIQHWSDQCLGERTTYQIW